MAPVPGILQARTLEWVAISFSNTWKWKVKVKLLSRVGLSATPWTAAYQAPPSRGVSRQEYWSGVAFPSPGEDTGERYKNMCRVYTGNVCPAVSDEVSPIPGQLDQLQVLPAACHTASFSTLTEVPDPGTSLTEHLSSWRLLLMATVTQQHPERKDSREPLRQRAITTSRPVIGPHPQMHPLGLPVGWEGVEKCPVL